MSDAIEPCPFCGAVWPTVQAYQAYYAGYWQSRCFKCMASASIERNENDARQAWSKLAASVRAGEAKDKEIDQLKHDKQSTNLALLEAMHRLRESEMELAEAKQALAERMAGCNELSEARNVLKAIEWTGKYGCPCCGHPSNVAKHIAECELSGLIRDEKTRTWKT